MATEWREHPPQRNVEIKREKEGTNRCKSPGAASKVFNLHNLIRNGKVSDPISHMPLTSRIGPVEATLPKWIFAVRENTIKVALDDAGSREHRSDPFPQNAVKHESLFSNEPVSAAGEIEFTDGVATDYNNLSGTYLIPMDQDFKGSLRESLISNNIPFANVLQTRLL